MPSLRTLIVIALSATQAFAAPYRRQGPPAGSPTFTFTLNDGSIVTETLPALTSGAPRPTGPPTFTYTLKDGTTQVISPTPPAGGRHGRPHGGFGGGNETHVIPVTLSNGEVVSVTMSPPTGTVKPTGPPVLTVTASSGAVETITLTRPNRTHGPHDGQPPVIPVTLSNGEVVSVTLSSPTGTAMPTGTPPPLVVTVTASSGAVETVTLDPPQDGPQGGPPDMDGDGPDMAESTTV